MLYRTVFLILSLIAGQSAMALEEPQYEVLAEFDDFEVRHYDPYIVAEVDVSGNGADNRAFRILAGYIFGDNRRGEKMAMTAPVESRPNDRGERMAMTAPVISSSRRDEEMTYAFVMERKYSLDTLPTPVNERIRLLERPARTVAVRRFSGRWSDSNIDRHEQRLLRALDDTGIQGTGVPELARYNSPFTPPFLRRNEVIVPVAWNEDRT